MKAMKLAQEEMISQHEFLIICTAVTLVRDKANNLMNCRGDDQPPPYVFLCAVLVNIVLLQWKSYPLLLFRMPSYSGHCASCDGADFLLSIG